MSSARRLVVAPGSLAVAAVTAVIAGIATVGADARWLAALGSTIVAERAIPNAVPYASAPSEGWPNVLVLAQVVFHWLAGVPGERGFLLAHVVAVLVGLAALALAMRRTGATDWGIAATVPLIALGGVAALAVVRLQLFSLALFPVLLLLLHEEARRPSRRIWLLVPLAALWSNLHGAVLAGLAVAGAYLLLARLRAEPVTAVGVGVASIAALAVTPALERTPAYYLGVLENEAAARGAGLWAPLSLSSPLDLLFVAAAVVLVVLALRARPALWEWAALAGLAFLTLRTARAGIWLLLVAAVPAARAVPLRGSVRMPVGAAVVSACLVVALFAFVRGPLPSGADETLLGEALAEARGTPILAEPLLAEQVALAGGRIWIGNPIDAFASADQRLYLDWVEGLPAGDAALEHAPRVVLVDAAGDAVMRTAADPQLEERGRSRSAVLYVRRDGG
jgi:hypothetical protein